MADIHDRGRALAIRLLAPRPAGKGGPFTLQRVSEEDYSPGGNTGTGGVTEFNGSALRTMYESKDVDGELIRRDDVKFIVSPALQNGSDMPHPREGDRCMFFGVTYAVVSAKIGNYAGVDCVFWVQARQ